MAVDKRPAGEEPAGPSAAAPGPGSEARLAILAKVRQAQVRARLPAPPAGLPRALAYPSLDPGALRNRLLRELELLGVETHAVAGDAEARATVKRLIAGKTVLSWDPGELPCGVAECLAGETVHFGSHPRAQQGRADIGLTGCEAALAETGSLAMVARPGRPRTPSLLPYVHVAVIRGRDIVLGMGEFLDRYRREAPLPYAVFITGPSRTADIELSLTLGVHGPGKVIAVLAP